jgi:adenylate cyclase
VTEPWRRRPSAIPALVVIALLAAVRAADPFPVERLRLVAFDTMQRWRPRVADAALRPVVVVDIDETSLARHGQWPWPRATIARLVDAIAAAHPAAVGVDLLLVEPDRWSGDDALAASLARVPSVVAVAPVRAAGATGTPPARMTPVLSRGDEARAALPAYDGLVRSLDPIDAAAAGRGAIVVIPEPDGVVRRLPVAVRVGGAVVPSFALEMVRVAAGATALGLESGSGGVARAEAGGFQVPTSPDGRIWLHESRHEAWRFVSAADLLDGRASLPSSRLVLIGSTAVGLGDVVATPVEPAMSGIEIHAQAIESILGGTLLRRPGWTTPLELAAGALAGLAVLLLVRRLPAKRGPLALLVIVPLPLAAWWAFTRGLLLDPTWPAVIAIAAFPAALASSLLVEERRRRRVEGEMEAAREIQMAMLPRVEEVTAGRSDLELAAAIVPARYVGGDLYDVVWLDGSRLFFLVGDVSGKGAPAALFMAMVKTLSRSLALRSRNGAAGVFVDVDREIASQNPAMMFVTAVAGILDVGTGELDLACAGHDAPILSVPGEPPRALTVAAGPPLGTVTGFIYESTRTRLEPGVCLLVITDGVTDAAAAGGERFGKARVLASAGRGSAAPADVVARLLDEVQRFSSGAEPADDVTMLALRIGVRSATESIHQK